MRSGRKLRLSPDAGPGRVSRVTGGVYYTHSVYSSNLGIHKTMIDSTWRAMNDINLYRVRVTREAWVVLPWSASAVYGYFPGHSVYDGYG